MLSKSLDRQQVASVLVFVISIVLVYYLLHTYTQLRRIPGPLIAKFTDVHRYVLARGGLIHLYQTRAHQRYGPVVRFGPNMVSICDPEAIPTVFHMRTGFAKSKMYRAFRPWTPAGPLPSVFSAEDDATNRQMKQHVAVYYSLSYTVSSFEQRVEDAIHLLFDQLDTQFVAKGAHCDLTRWFKYFSYDAMGLMTFSRAYGHLQHGRDFSGTIAEVKKSMLAIGPMTQIPWLDWLLHKNRLVNFIKPEAMSTLFAYVLARIAERRKNPKKLDKADVDGPDASGDFLDYFLQAEEKKSGKVSPRFLPMWTLANILGGSDSAASVLRSVICSLVEHPEDLESVREELRNKQRSTTGLSLPVPKWREIQNLPFLDACIKEALRLEPPFAMTLERVVPAEGATICGRFFPAGTIVGMSPYATHRYRPTWGEDADLWHPHRWLDGDPERVRKLEASLLTFGAGTRVCFGQHVAMFEMKKLLTALVMTYDFDLVKPRGKVDRYSWIIMPESVQATVRKYDKVNI